MLYKQGLEIALFFMGRRVLMVGMAPNPQKDLMIKLEPFKGMNLSVTGTQISNSHSPDMVNFNIDEHGALNKRTGYERIYNSSLGAGKINGIYEYQKSDGSSIFLIAHGTKLYTQSGSAQPVVLYSGIQNTKVNFFTMSNKCYIMDGVNFLVYDGTTIAQVTPYIPTISISKNPAGGGTINEDFNLLGAGFKDSFSGDGTAKDYYLTLKGLDATTVSAVVGTTTINEGSGLTVDRTNGKVSFTTAPAQGTNNVIITAYKTMSGYSDRIKKCIWTTPFGGSNDTRMFASGNPNMPEYVWRSGLYDPTYWPENGFYKLPERVMGFSKQYDYLIVERPNGKHVVNYQLDDNGLATFPMKPINDQVGTLASETIQVIENNPVSLSKDGVYMLMASNVRDERNVAHISVAIDKRLLNETGLNNAISVDYDKKYWLALNGNVYVLDYTQKSETNPHGEWFIYNNINASCFLEMGGFLYFGSSTTGMVYRFKKSTTDANSYSDDGVAINAYWKSKPLTFDADEFKKYIDSVFLGIKPIGQTSVDLSYESDKNQAVLGGNVPIQFNLFDFNNLDFRNFSFQFSSFPQAVKVKVKAKKITHFQLMIQNNKLNEGLTVLSLAIKYKYQGPIK